jgi:hypothetical protein
MQMKRKDWWVWYNPQNITENQFILTTIVPNSAWDVKELLPILTKFYDNYWTYPENQLADAWYASEENYQFLQDNNIISYVPHPKLQINIDDYIHNSEDNTYQDRDWNIYHFKQHIGSKKWWKKWRPLKSKELEVGEIKKTVYMTTLPDWKKKFIKINPWLHQLYKDNDDRLYSQEWREVYKKRSGCVENVFWNIKANLGFEKFRLRWFEWVQIERNLISLAHNLKKLIKFQLAY